MDRLLNFHGQRAARLDQSQSIYKRFKQPRSWPMTLLSRFLFAAPNVHSNAIGKLWVDKLTVRHRCKDFFSKLNSQWGEHVVHASILLNANVAFLAIPSVDLSGDPEFSLHFRSAAQIASYMSVIASFGSMMLSLLLVRKHRKVEVGTAEEFHQYFERHDSDGTGHGFERLAILYSLPYSLLTWGLDGNLSHGFFTDVLPSFEHDHPFRHRIRYSR
ncbi:hypothetical protein H0H81_007861, partial [Sphagnurus paluster]